MSTHEMTPKRAILLQVIRDAAASGYYVEGLASGLYVDGPDMVADAVGFPTDQLEFIVNESWPDELEDFRGSGDPATIDPDPVEPYRSYYEYEHHARVLDGGTLAVGWVYWHGGGKHGEPSSVPWLGDAVFMDWSEVTVVTYRYTMPETGEVES